MSRARAGVRNNSKLIDSERPVARVELASSAEIIGVGIWVGSKAVCHKAVCHEAVCNKVVYKNAICKNAMSGKKRGSHSGQV
jgi:hypothetical protein